MASLSLTPAYLMSFFLVKTRPPFLGDQMTMIKMLKKIMILIKCLIFQDLVVLEDLIRA